MFKYKQIIKAKRWRKINSKNAGRTISVSEKDEHYVKGKMKLSNIMWYFKKTHLQGIIFNQTSGVGRRDMHIVIVRK